jgi:Type I restriction modification DNA specificity domain
MDELVPLHRLFRITYGVNLELVNLEKCDKSFPGAVNFVSRSERNNGIAAFVKPIIGQKTNPAHTISVAGGGSVLASFYQPEAYYSGRDLYILEPLFKLSIPEMIYYASCIRQNRYRYSYGRQANRTLKDILVPDNVPNWVKTPSMEKLTFVSNNSVNLNSTELDTESWMYFKYGGESGIFIIKNGYYNKKPDRSEKGIIPFIGSSEYNNGVTGLYTLEDLLCTNKDERSVHHDISKKLFKGNCITVANNGASVSSAFYQPNDFTCSHDVNVLLLKERPFNKYIALFICTLINQEKYRWSYGRKWRPSRMPFSEIKLPVRDGRPDFEFMENYIKGLPFSSAI